MIKFEEAIKITEKEAIRLDAEKVDLSVANGRVLAGDVYADADMPPFNKSAMDGFACRRADLDNVLEVVETIKAGDVPLKTIGKNQCAKIMTGGKVPGGADCVIMIEQTVAVDGNRIRFTGSKTEDNIALQAEDIRSGQVVAAAGTLLRAQHIAILASAGWVHPLVYRRPSVAVLTTGDEIVEPDVRPEGTCIRNSNGPQLIAQVEDMCAEPRYLGIVPDTPEGTFAAIGHALEDNDVVLITGGVSRGDFDFVPSVLEKHGVRLLFSQVAVKPGRPTVFGLKDRHFVFGLPGNPVSSFIIFELMVKPFLYRLMGHVYRPFKVRLPMGTDYSRKKADRIAWSPVFINENAEVIPAEYHGSAHIHSLCGAHGLMDMPVGVYNYKKGDLVNVRQL